VQFVRLPFVTLKVARQKVADGSAGFDDRLAMILNNANLQQWDELWKHVDAAEQLAADKPGVRWLRTILLATVRRNDEARQRYLAEARQLAQTPVADAPGSPTGRDELYLAEFILGQTYHLSGWTEYHEIVETLKPFYERQPAELDVLPQWQERKAQCLDGLQRHEEALALRRVRADAAPWQLDWQIDFARRLQQTGQIDAALERLRAELNRPIERTDSEDESIRSAITEVYRTHSRWADLLTFTTEWISRKPKSSSYNSGYAQHLTALVFNDRLDDANALVETWLTEARVERKLAADERARLEAALNFAHGSTYNLSIQRIDERWFEPLAQTARFFLKHAHHPDVAQRAIGNHYFQQSDVADALRGNFLGLLQSDLATLTPAQLQTLIGWTLSGRIELAQPLAGRKQMDASEVPDDVWRKIADELKPRWTASTDKEEKNLLSEALRSIYAQRFAATDLLPFLRERIATAHADYKAGYVSVLFEALLSTGWTEGIEQEAFDRLRDLSTADEPVDRLVLQVPALYRLVDAMLANRQALSQKELNDQGQSNQLTRQQLAEKKAEFRKAALSGVAARLAAESAKEQGLIKPWLVIERTWIDMQLSENLAQIEEDCWQMLGEVPPKLAADADSDEEVTEAQARQRLFDGLLKQRAFTTVMNLAARRTAQPPTIDRVQKYIDAGIEKVSGTLRSVPDTGDAADVWRNTKFRLLIALDRPDELERTLRGWIGGESSTAPWRQMLARLLAERGKIDDAITLFEASQKDKLLSAADYRLLADWYLVGNRRADYERSRIEAFKQLPENSLNNLLYQVRNRWNRSDQPLPSELDGNTLFALKALFLKSGSPENYLWQVREIYTASRDFRLLQMLPDAVLGRSPQQAYAFLQTLHSQVLYELRNEATADEILARVRALRDGERTTTDLRALDLLEAVVERKSSEVLNQPGPHVDACLAALQRAFDRDWLDGEPVQMAGFLNGLGKLPHPKLVDEQLREFRELQRRAPAASRDHLQITTHYTQALFRHYGRRDEALREMEAEVRAYTAAHQGKWPHQDNAQLDSYVGLYEAATRHAAGEAVLKTFLAVPEHDEQAKWLKDRLVGLYNHALEHQGAVSLGENSELFKNLLAYELKELDAAPDEHVRYHLVNRIVATFNIAHRRKLDGVAPALRTFAFTTIPAVLKNQQSHYRYTATSPLHIVGVVLGPAGALQYLVERMEQYPQRLEISWDNSWNAFGYELAQRREECANAKLNIEALEPRILTLVVRELKRELRTGENRSRYIYHNDNSYFWKEQTPAFARAAEEVLAERPTSGRRAMNVANYLWSGLDLYPRAIEILLAAHKDGLLEESSQVRLVEWLHHQDRHGESIPLLEPLIAARADNMRYRTLLMVAYFKSQRPQQLAELVAQTDAHFHQAGRWTEGNVAQFARGCSSSELFDRAAGYFDEAIALHQRSHGGRVLGDAALSEMYHDLAYVQSRRGQTKKAVDAASAAIVCWTPNQHQRRSALDRLDYVLKEAKDLDDYVRQLDEKSTQTGQDSPILRKALGKTYQSRGDHAKAIAQFDVASQLQPNDQEIHQALIACYDSTQNADAATKQLLKLIDLNRHDLALYKQLADRMKGNEAEAERAATSIVEASPNEAENHAALAELRQQQNRWDEAIPHWKQVAELRRLEPTGLLKLAEAQLHEKQWDAAQESIQKLQRTEWPSRFSDVTNQTRQLQQQLPK
jgi:Flp pilus assembly protein TadD